MEYSLQVNSLDNNNTEIKSRSLPLHRTKPVSLSYFCVFIDCLFVYGCFNSCACVCTIVLVLVRCMHFRFRLCFSCRSYVCSCWSSLLALTWVFAFVHVRISSNNRRGKFAVVKKLFLNKRKQACTAESWPSHLVDFRVFSNRSCGR